MHLSSKKFLKMLGMHKDMAIFLRMHFMRVEKM